MDHQNSAPDDASRHDVMARVLDRAVEIAESYGHEVVTREHLLFVSLEEPDVRACVTALGPDPDQIKVMMEDALRVMHRHVGRLDPPAISEALREVVIAAVGLARYTPTARAPINYLWLLAQSPYEDSPAVTALLQNGITPARVKSYIAHGQAAPRIVREGGVRKRALGAGGVEGGHGDGPKTEAEALEVLAQFCVNLNTEAKEGRIDLLVGRDDEITQIVQITARRTKNNALLVGEPGVGKTALVEGLALRIVREDVPETLLDATVWSLDVGALVAGTRYRGDFEERMKNVLKALTLVPKPVLFIDEVHTIMDAGAGGKGSLDVSNLLKPALQKGLLRCVGSTTYEEYRKHFEKDRALMRRFKRVDVGEPTPDQAKDILRGLRPAYEKHHGLAYSDAALDAAVDLTSRYVQTGHLPDKAIDVLDAAGARQRIIPQEARVSTITAREIEVEVARIARIPEKEVQEDEAEKMERLDEALREVVFGQDAAIHAVADAVRVARAGLRAPDKPEGCFLFVGPTGCGKAQPMYSQVLTPTGFVRMDEVEVGMAVCTPDGGVAPVSGVFPQGPRAVFRLTFADGRQADCCDEHLWRVRNVDLAPRERIMPLSELRQRMTKLKRPFYIPLPRSVAHPEASLPIDPYVLGAILGDGNISQDLVRFSTADDHVLARFSARLPPECRVVQYESNRAADYNIIGQKHLLPHFRALGLVRGTVSLNKFIPEPYFVASHEQRLELVRGLLDTDGEATKLGSVSYSTGSLALAVGMIRLIRSLGGWAKLSNKYPTFTYNGEARHGAESFLVSIRYPKPRELFTLPRKVARLPEHYQYADLWLKVIRIEPVGEFETQCIRVDHTDHLYITDDYTVTHNTEVAKQTAATLGIPLIRFDMSEYMEKHAVSRLIGAPPGYVGYGEGGTGNGLLINAVDQQPRCVLLLDEVEKAHEEVYNLLLQVMDAGRLTGASGKLVDFRNVILIMTTNAGVRGTDANPIGFGRQDKVADLDEAAIRRIFTPEFRNRLDAVVRFNPLNTAVMPRIVDKFIAELRALTEARGVRVAITPAARDWLAVKGYEPAFGARPMSRVIHEHIKKPLSRLMLFGALKHGGECQLDVGDDGLILQTPDVVVA